MNPSSLASGADGIGRTPAVARPVIVPCNLSDEARGGLAYAYSYGSANVP